MGLYIVCIAIFLLVLILVMSTSTRKPKAIKCEEKLPVEDAPDKFELYESVLQFMNKQRQYIQSLD